MSKYTIKELYEAYKADERPTPYAVTCFLGGPSWCYEPVSPEDVDTRPDWVKTAAASAYEPKFVRDYGEWIYCRDCGDVYEALDDFQDDNYVYELLHRTALTMVNKALQADYSPIENYDRYEDLNKLSHNHTSATSESGAKVSPDFTVGETTFYDTGKSDGTATGDTNVTETNTNHIHGNIGVTRADEMVSHVVGTYSDPAFSMYQVLVNKLLDDHCYLIV